MKALENNQKEKKEYAKKTEINNLVKKVYEKLKHTQKPNKRIETELKKLAPELTVYYELRHGLYVLTIWGDGLSYDNRYHLCSNESLGWEGIRKDLEIADMSDYLEKFEEEEAYYSQLEELEKQVLEIKEKAKNLCPKTVPASAKVRTDVWHWDAWSYKTKDNFPNLFKD